MTSFSNEQIAQEQQSFLVGVYSWMSMGLFLTAAIAYIVASSPNFVHLIYGNMLIFWGILIAELIMVSTIAVRVKHMSATSAMALFLGYSALNGLSLSMVFLIYTAASIASTFFITAGTFGAMSLYGYFTKRDLTGVGNFLYMALIGLIIASLVNIFMHSPLLYWVTTYAGVIIFVGLTAHDTQKIKELNVIGNMGTDEDTKEAINGALILYLDFINLFLSMLRIFGNRR